MFFVININYDLSYKHYAPERPVWSIQILGFPEAITISVIRSWKAQKLICNPTTFKSGTEIVWKLKHELWADTMLLWEHFRPERYP